MAEKIVYICDPHQHDGHDDVVSSVREPITLDGQEYIVDLCNECNEGWFVPFAERLRKVARTVPGSKSSRAATTPSKTAAPSKTDTSTRPYSRDEPGSKFRCKVCERGYDVKPSLYHHELAKHAGHPDLNHRQCPVCKEWKHGKGGVTNHVRQVHPEHYETFREQEPSSALFA